MAKLTDSFPSLLIDAALIRACKPLTAKQLIEATGLEAAEVNSILWRRTRKRRATLTKSPQRRKLDKNDTYDLTPEYYLDVKSRLQTLRLEPATWARAAHEFSRPGLRST